MSNTIFLILESKWWAMNRQFRVRTKDKMHLSALWKYVNLHSTNTPGNIIETWRKMTRFCSWSCPVLSWWIWCWGPSFIVEWSMIRILNTKTHRRWEWANIVLYHETIYRSLTGWIIHNLANTHMVGDPAAEFMWKNSFFSKRLSRYVCGREWRLGRCTMGNFMAAAHIQPMGGMFIMNSKVYIQRE